MHEVKQTFELPVEKAQCATVWCACVEHVYWILVEAGQFGVWCVCCVVSTASEIISEWNSWKYRWNAYRFV